MNPSRLWIVIAVFLVSVTGHAPGTNGEVGVDLQSCPQPVRWPGEGGNKVVVNLGIVFVVEFADQPP